ncbi:hypothetical protein TSUD_175630 [Trifolium subterraneum]|uniref:Fe2OG dioxygenase domain-containing protein n=1 Tax=Trifolium subterraneum TaxID=3900 RepID=A0A2Z6LKC2_TRISU|nr:hypothetical protein TSUD_175630 [Trifolium subterraneum]
MRNCICLPDLISRKHHRYDREAELRAFDDSKAGVKGLVESGVSKIPRMFHGGKLDIGENSGSDSKLSVPVVDLKDISANPVLRVEVIDQIRSACQEWGFFQVINHGIPVNVLDEMIDGTRRFHEQDADVRKEFYTRDLKERFKYYSNGALFSGQAANWRDTFSFVVAPGTFKPEVLPPICRDIAVEYSQKIRGLGFTIFELLSEALGLDPSYLKEFNCAEGLSINGHYYPPCPEPELTMGTTKHIDVDFMTLVLQERIGGLQVLHEDKWVNVPPVHGALVVNIGAYHKWQWTEDAPLRVKYPRLFHVSEQRHSKVGEMGTWHDSNGIYSVKSAYSVLELTSRVEIVPPTVPGFVLAKVWKSWVPSKLSLWITSS